MRLCKRQGCTDTPKKDCVYCSAHNPVKDPVWRRHRGYLGGKAATLAHVCRSRAAVQGMTPVQAYVRGYRTGYNRAMKFWKRWAEQVTRTAA
jgi:hypothetical protein